MKEAQSLASQTKYQYSVDYEQAPYTTNCVTSVRYLFETALKQPFPYVWIGDMPRKLVAEYRCKIHQVALEELKPGDLLFLRKNSSNTTYKAHRYITHLVMALASGECFHCSEHRDGGKIECLSRPLDEYARSLAKRVVDEPYLFLRYIDPRNAKLLEEHEGEFLIFPVPRPLPNVAEEFDSHHQRSSK